MAAFTQTDNLRRVFSNTNLVGAGFLGVVALLVIPLPPVMLDLLLAISIGLSAVVFLTSLFTERPADFSIFPTLLLIATLMRLSLNIASTRLILLHGHEGPEAAGAIIQAFGNFVAGGSVGVGLIVFLVLVTINFVVITKGSGRIAEVSARFTLDAMPGKQMAIDAELNAGAIDDQEAKSRRRQIEDQADFYGSMDGASKFVSGDAIAGIIITAINLLGGLAIGMLQQDLEFSTAISSYSILTIGDGLVSQMPALVLSTAAGLVISRASGKMEFGEQMVLQLTGGKQVLGLTSLFLFLLGLVPGLPFFPFFLLSSALAFVVYRQNKAAKKPEKEEKPVYEPPPEPTMDELLHVDTLVLEVGYGLLQLVDHTRGGEIPERVKKLRHQLAQELGLIIPPVRVIDNLDLRPGEYVIKLHGFEVARAEIMTDRQLAIDSAGQQDFPGGIETQEPVFGLKAFWILNEDRNRAEARGLAVVDPTTVMVTHLAEVLRKNADNLITRDHVDELLAFVKKESPKLVEELVPTQLSLGEVHAVLKSLLSERISVRNLKLILEALATISPHTKELRILIDASRAALWRQITEMISNENGAIFALTVDPKTEQVLRNSMSPSGQIAPDPRIFESIARQIQETAARLGQDGHSPCLLAPDDIRKPLRDLLSISMPDLPVVALREIDPQAKLSVVGRISHMSPQGA